MKFGKKEHLEELKNGRIFFNAVKKYRNDGTDYRGDSMEGKIPLDPLYIKILDEGGKTFLIICQDQMKLQKCYAMMKIFLCFVLLL